MDAAPFPQNRRTDDATWRAACRLVLQAAYNTAEGLNRIKESGRRAAANRVWHGLSLADGLRSLFGRFKVVLCVLLLPLEAALTG